MSDDGKQHVKAHAGVAEGAASAGEPEAGVGRVGRGNQYAGPADEVWTVVVVPEGPAGPAPQPDVDTFAPEWKATRVAYWAWRHRNHGQRPPQAELARERGMSERTLSGKLRALGVADYRHVHALMEADPL